MKRTRDGISAPVVSPVRIPMSSAVVGGVIISTVLTLFVVPCFYSVAEEWREHLKRGWRLVFAASGSSGAAAAVQSAGKEKELVS